jgi:hypothetical protein
MQSSQIYETSLISQIITHFFLYCAMDMLDIGSLLLNKKTGSSYLNARMPKDDPTKLVHMAIAPIIATTLTDFDPSN